MRFEDVTAWSAVCRSAATGESSPTSRTRSRTGFVDRTAGSSHLYEPLHPAILRLIHQTVQAAHAAGKWVGMCGEMASDPEVTPILIGLELDELSVSPALVPKLKKNIRDLDYAACRALTQEVMKDPSRDNVQKLLRRFRNR